MGSRKGEREYRSVGYKDRKKGGSEEGRLWRKWKKWRN